MDSHASSRREAEGDLAGAHTRVHTHAHTLGSCVTAGTGQRDHRPANARSPQVLGEARDRLSLAASGGSAALQTP